MSSQTYVNEKGAGQKHSDLGHYSQAVILGDIVKCSGQGGWDSEGNLEGYDERAQIDNAFDNVDRVLQAAGLRGWEDVRNDQLAIPSKRHTDIKTQVYCLRSYQLNIGEHWSYLVEKLRKRIPDHRPIWTALSVPSLAFKPMTVELEVEAIRRH